MNDAHQALYVRISEFSFDEGDEDLTFAQRLARENGWKIGYTDRVIEEYKRFMFLAVVAEHPVTPSDQVDQVWHLHLAYTRSYWERWCKAVLKTPVHHGPTKGGRAEGRKFHHWYENTRNSYRDFFGQSPPDDIWPDPSIRFGDDLHYQRINTRGKWVIPKPLRRTNGLLFAAIMFPAAAGAGSASLFAQGELRAILFVIALVAWVAFIVWTIYRIGRGGSGSDSGCGGDGGCGDGGCGDGGCGGCGG